MNENKLEVALVKCYFCGKEKGKVMNTKLTKKSAEAIRKMNGHAIDYEPCEECKKLMEQGIMFCSVKDGESGNNPYRTGNICVIKENAVEKMMTPEMFEKVRKTRFVFIEDSIWDMLGLQKKDINGIIKEKQRQEDVSKN